MSNYDFYTQYINDSSVTNEKIFLLRKDHLWIYGKAFVHIFKSILMDFSLIAVLWVRENFLIKTMPSGAPFSLLICFLSNYVFYE